MICPYAVNRTIVTQTAFEYDEEGKTTQQQTVEKSEAAFLHCAKEDCGAWRNGHCQYREIN